MDWLEWTAGSVFYLAQTAPPQTNQAATVLSDSVGFVFGVCGGLLAELLGLYKLRHTPTGDLPDYLRSWFYWGISAVMVMAGGLLVLAYLWSNVSLTPIIAINLGASGPLILQTFVANVPPVSPGRTD